MTVIQVSLLRLNRRHRHRLDRKGEGRRVMEVEVGTAEVI